jgi:hypothetical protein
MPTALSIETKLRDGLKLRGISSTEFAELAKLEGIANSSRAVLDKAFRDAGSLRNETAQRLSALWDEIELMIYDFLPFPLDVSSGARTFTSLQIYRGMMTLRGNDVSTNNSNNVANDSVLGQSE